MAPEQFLGEATPRSDVYALGAVLFEALSGLQWPVAGQSDPDWTGVDAELQPILRKALSLRPEDRWPDAGSFRQALLSWQTSPGGLPVTATSRGLVARIRELLFGSPRPTPARKSIAVLPLKNLSRDEDTDVIADGITEDIIAHLSRIQELKVISRTSIMRYRVVDRPLKRIGEELGVASLLEGSVRRSGDRLRIVSQLFDAATEECRWTETFDRDLTDIFAVQSEVAQRIAGSLEATISDAELSLIRRRPTDNVEAHKLYLRGRYLWNRRTREGLDGAARAFTQAIELDPDFAPAHAGLADTKLLLGAYGYIPELAAVAQAKASIETALGKDDRLAEAHASLGQVLRTERNWAAEEQAYRRAIALNPNYATAHQWYATLLAALGRHDEAAAEIALAQDLDPLSSAIGVTAGSLLCLRRDYEAAIEQLHRTLELDPDYFSPHAWLINAYGASGQKKGAMEAYARVAELRGDLRHSSMFLALVHAFLGEEEEARAVLASHEGERADPIALGIVHAQLGDADRAFQLLLGALEDDSWCMFLLLRNLLLYVRSGSWFDPVREDPRFEDLLGRMNLSA